MAATAKPTWTATVSSGRSSPVVCHSAASSELTADALNHGPNASSTADADDGQLQPATLRLAIRRRRDPAARSAGSRHSGSIV